MVDRFRNRHPIAAHLRRLRDNAHLSLAQFRDLHGVDDVTLGNYERGDRQPNLWQTDHILAAHGHKLAVVPTDFDVDKAVRELAELRLFRAQVVAAYREVGNTITERKAA
jgi:transcriptional regulator with XRE-family HTH domain